MKLFRSSQSKGNVFFIPYSVYVEGRFFFFFFLEGSFLLGEPKTLSYIRRLKPYFEKKKTDSLSLRAQLIN